VTIDYGEDELRDDFNFVLHSVVREGTSCIDGVGWTD
jgi:hypothetical protein